MAYAIEITARAARDFASLYTEIDAENSEAARKWYRGLRKAVLSLEEMPNRCPAARENPRLRHLLYGRKPRIYRVIYRVLEHERRVEILHIRHGAMSEFETSDLV